MDKSSFHFNYSLCFVLCLKCFVFFFIFQKKLRDLQKWHNELEFKLFKCRDYTNNGNGSLSSRTNTSSSDVERNET